MYPLFLRNILVSFECFLSLLNIKCPIHELVFTGTQTVSAHQVHYKKTIGEFCDLKTWFSDYYMYLDYMKQFIRTGLNKYRNQQLRNHYLISNDVKKPSDFGNVSQ